MSGGEFVISEMVIILFFALLLVFVSMCVARYFAFEKSLSKIQHIDTKRYMDIKKMNFFIIKNKLH